MGKFRILSIDWDYFINATADERAFYFPDSGNEHLPEFLQNSIWASRYCQDGDQKLEDFKVDDEEVEHIRHIVYHQNPSFKADVQESHALLYSFAKSLFEKSAEDTLEIVNIDFHHDVYDFYNEKVHCGNWLAHIITEYPDGEYHWIRKDDSDELLVEFKGSIKEHMGMISFEELFNEDFDYVFVCKSGMWSPPHLDKEFISTFRRLPYINISYSKYSVFHDRMESVKVEAEAVKAQRQELLKYMKEETEDNPWNS